MLRDGESNPGLPRDRRGYSPLYYRGDDKLLKCRLYKFSERNAPFLIQLVNYDLPYLALFKSP